MRRFFLLIVLFLFVATPAIGAPSLSHSKLFKSTRALIAEARVRGERDFGVVIASAPGANSRVAAAIQSAGGRIARRVDEVDYIRAKVPLAKLESIADLPSVSAIDADADITDLNVGTPNQPGASPTPSAPPKRTAKDEAPLLHPYLPGTDIGTLALRAAHATFDGRGVTIALIDGTPDFLLPEFRHAKALDGSDEPKIVDLITSTDAKSEQRDYSEWIDMPTTVQASDGAFVYMGARYATPHDGSFRFGFIRNTPIFAPLIDPDAKPKPKKNAPLFGVLWDEQSNTVWVDSNSDRNFAEEKPLTDYTVHHDYGTFPVHPKDPEARPTIGFVVQTDRINHAIAILLGDGDHASGAGGSAVGAGLLNGKYDNIAPGARLMSISPNYKSHGLIEAVIRAEQDPRVDLVCIEVISAESYGFKDGHFTQSVIYDRLTKRYNKPIFQPADNSKGLSKIEEAGIPEHVFSIGAYQSRESYRVDAGIDVPNRDNLHFVSAYGPTNNGAFKPTILAPSGYVSLSNGYEASRALKGVYNLRPGYQMFGGTSQATPTATGAVAVLISAARQSRIAVTVPQLIRAVEHTARYITTLPAYQQGPGLIQVDRAYAELRRLSSREPDTVVVRAPVRTIVSQYLPTSDIGVGLYEREGWSTGMQGTRKIELTRTTGQVAPKTFRVVLEGNDGTFTVPDSVTLARGAPNSISVAIRTSSAGVHSAVMELIDVQTQAIVLQSYLAVVAAEQFVAANGYTVSHHILVPRTGGSSVFVNVPPGTQALRVTFQTHDRKLDFSSLLPDATEADVPANFYLGGSQINPGTSTYFFPHPEPGVWELELLDLSDLFAHDKVQQHPVRPTPVQFAASLIGVSAESDGYGISAQNKLAPIPNATFTREAATFSQHTGELQSGQQIVYNVQVSEGATHLGAILETSDPGSDVDLYIFDCTKKCHLKYRTTHFDGRNEASIDSPVAGKWKIVIDGYAAGAKGARFHYVDYVTSPVIGVSKLPGRYSGTLFSLSLLGNDPDLYDNEVDGGPVKPRKGQNPITVTAFPLSAK